jgi:hypothetical protein
MAVAHVEGAVCSESANGDTGEIATQGLGNYLGRQRTRRGLGKSDSEANGQECDYEIRVGLRHVNTDIDAFCVICTLLLAMLLSRHHIPSTTAPSSGTSVTSTATTTHPP